VTRSNSYEKILLQQNKEEVKLMTECGRKTMVRLAAQSAWEMRRVQNMFNYERKGCVIQMLP
jgi:hypothetical protein